MTEIEKRVIFSVFLKKLKRKPILPIISFLLLSLSGGLLCCGAELFRTAAIKSAESDDAFSVILEADAEALQLKSGLTADFAAYKYDYEKTLSAESRYRRLLNLVWDIGDELDYASYDDRRQYAAVGDAISPAASIVLSSESHDPYYDGDLLRAVVSVKCHAVVHNEQAELRDGTADHVYVVWQTEEIIASNKLLGALPEYMVSALILPYDGFSAEINVGASYLLSGCAVFPGYYEYQQEYSAFVPDSNTVPGLFIFTALPQKAAQAETWVYLTDDLSPCIADLGDSDVENFLFGESGEPWLSEIENTKILSNSFYIMTTNSLESTPGFHSGEVQLVSGRSFTPKDYASGAKVCLISFGAAQANGLTVGDTIAVTLYETGYTREYGGETGRNPLFYEWFFADQNYSEALGAEEFQIIGIYSDPGWGRGEGELSVNTVFVPAEALSSYPEMPNSFYGEPRHNNILLVNNSSIDKLLKELEASPVRSFLHLNDNGYLQSRAFISNARIYALILFVLGAAVWLICAVLFVQNYMYGTLRTASSLTALGANPTVSNLAVLLDSALISTLSSLAGFGIGCAAVGVIGELIEKLSRIGVDNLSFAEIEPALSSAPHCGVMLAAAGAAWAILILLSAGGLLKNERCRKN